jgi:putative DNA primase/helicase
VIAAKIAAALGGAQREGRGWRCRCPLHGGHSLVIGDGREGRLLIRCWGGGCAPADILAELRRLGLLDARHDRHRPPPTVPGLNECKGPARRMEIARGIWDAAQNAHGTPVVAYLAHRGIAIDPPRSLRWAPSLRRPDGAYGPAMLARIDNIAGDLIGLSRTWLLRDDYSWRRRNRAMLGRAAGGAVRLAPAAETLLLAEGIETTLAGMIATGLSGWAALSTSGLVALVLPPIVQHIIILADQDVSGAGERAAYSAAARWLHEGRWVRVVVPAEPGTDFNDTLLGRSYPRIAEACDAAA